jgi:hypothetical protein
VIEVILEAVGVRGYGLEQRSGQQKESCFAIHGGNKCKQDA